MTVSDSLSCILAVIIAYTLSFPNGTAQIIHVNDAETGRSLPYVNIFTSDHSIVVQTNNKGIASLKSFSRGDSLHLSHVGYDRNVWVVPNSIRDTLYEINLSPSTVGVDEVIISAHRWEQSSREVPATIDRINAEEVSVQNPQTAADLLDLSGTVFVQKSQMGGGSPMLRGFATKRVLLVVDGVRLNTAIFRGGNIQNVISLGAQSIEHTEILFGPGSVIYGSDALGGVMDFHTLQPEFSTDDSWRISGRTKVRYSSSNDERTIHGHLKAGKGNWASVTSVTYSDYGDMSMGSNGPDDYLRTEYTARKNGRDTALKNPEPQVQRPTAYAQWNILQKVAYRPNPNWEFQLNTQYSETTDIPRYDRLIQGEDGQFSNAEWYYGPQIWGMGQIRARHNANTVLYDQMRVIGAYQQFRESRHDRKWQEDWIRHRHERVDAWSFNLDFDKKFSDRWSLYYGLEAVYNGISSRAEEERITNDTEREAPSRYPDGSDWQSHAVYANAKWTFRDAWTLQAGVRYNRIIAHADFDTEFYDFPFRSADLNQGAITGSLGLTFSPSANHKLYSNASTGFRAPNIDDIGKVFDSEPGSVVVPNPNLSPEYAYNFELGGHHRFEELDVQWAGYYTILEDALARRPFTLGGRDSILYDGVISEVLAIQNVSKARVFGVQMQLSGAIADHFKWSVSYNWQEGKELRDEESDTYVPLRHAAPPFGRARISYEQDAWSLALQGSFNQKFEYEDLSLSERGKPHLYALNDAGQPYSPGWWIVHVQGSYHLSDQITIRASLDNILDKRYRPYSSGIAAAGRSITISLSADIE